MRYIMLVLLVSGALMLTGCATTGAGDNEAVAPDSFQSATPSNEYIYRGPPPNVARALR